MDTGRKIVKRAVAVLFVLSVLVVSTALAQVPATTPEPSTDQMLAPTQEILGGAQPAAAAPAEAAPAGIAPLSTVATNCPGAAPTRLLGQRQARVAQAFSSLRAGIGSDIVYRTMPSKAVFDIIGGPVCAGPHYWWQVRYQGVTGWATEGTGEFGFNDYWMEPVTGGPVPTVTFVVPTVVGPTPFPTLIPGTPVPNPGGVVVTGPVNTACPGSVPPRLIGKARAVVAQAFSTLRAGVHSDTVYAIMPGGAAMDVLSGPYCSNFGPYNWYQVRYNGVTGWVTEGTASGGFNDYWLAPG
jgi:hypothetical protein